MICSFSLQLKQMPYLFIILISIKLESLTSALHSLVLWISLSSILDANLDGLIVCFLKIPFITCLAFLNLTALRYYSFKVRPLFIPPISTSLQAKPVFNLSLNIPTRAISLYPVMSFQAQKSSQ